MRASYTVKVVRADQSPLNERKWRCDLACGHSVWVTRSRRPTRVECRKQYPDNWRKVDDGSIGDFDWSNITKENE